MSEKQARLKRKSEPQQEVKKQKKSIWGNVIITVVIVVFLGLAGYALKDNIKSILPEKPEKEKTVSDLAKDKDMSVEDFIAEFGLENDEVTKDTTETDLMSKFTLANYAKYMGQTTEELKAMYGLEAIDENMLWQEATQYMPMAYYAQNMGLSFDELKEQAGLPDEITKETTLKEAEEIMAAQAEAEQSADDTAETEEAETEEAEEETADADAE